MTEVHSHGRRTLLELSMAGYPMQNSIKRQSVIILAMRRGGEGAGRAVGLDTAFFIILKTTQKRDKHAQSSGTIVI
jgi:hypothetical protein